MNAQSTSENILFRTKALVLKEPTIFGNDLSEKLTELGYEVVAITGSVKVAVELVKEIRPDVVLMDVGVKSGLSSVDAAVKIRSLYREPIPIVFVSEYSLGVFPGRESAKPYSVLIKPFSSDELALSLEKALSWQKTLP